MQWGNRHEFPDAGSIGNLAGVVCTVGDANTRNPREPVRTETCITKRTARAAVVGRIHKAGRRTGAHYGLLRGVEGQRRSGNRFASEPPDTLSSVTTMNPRAGVFLNSTGSMATATSADELGATGTNIAFDSDGAKALK